jgi:CelD/BcsL family acetyltransferase involved in cellulose biosynthesis
VQEKLFLEMTAANAFQVRPIEEQHSPFISLQDKWERHFAGLPKKFRATIRNGGKRLRERGELGYRECVGPQAVADFNAAVIEIEKDSWKGPAGTSIASNPVHEAFHRAITERAAENEFFSGHLLLLDQQPIAYVMGMLYNGVFLDLKESYRNTFREMSPGHVLKNFLFARLYERKVLLYDFMGNCEEYKMKWTDRTYCRVTYLFFNKTLRGKAAGWLSLLRPTKPKTNLPASMKNAPNTMNGKEGLQSASDSKDGDRCGKTVSV